MTHDRDPNLHDLLRRAAALAEERYGPCVAGVSSIVAAIARSEADRLCLSRGEREAMELALGMMEG